jgi:phosphatidylglycerophosphatase A
MRNLILFLATGAYSGYVPLIPGTAGSILGVVLARFICARLWMRSPAAFVMLFIVLFVGGCLLAGAAEKYAGEHDSSRIVIDEIFGMIAALFLIPISWIWILLGFALFRLFDVLKPWPASYFDRMSGGAGVMLDDLAAGIYANLVLQVASRVL